MSGCGGCQGNAEVSNVDQRPPITVQTTDKIVTLTDGAVSKVKEFMKLDKKETFGLRIQVVPGGCAGYQYGLDFDEKPQSNDFIREQKNLRIFIDPESAQLLLGTEIDFVESLQGSGFKINNPNAKSSCGCGNSFS